MKNFLTILILLVTNVSALWAQIPPDAFSYSAVARDANSNPIANQTLGIQISLRQGSPLGTIVYVENHFVNTDQFGLFNLTVGGGAIQSGNMSTIDWPAANYYLEVGMDANGGTNFLTMGTTQLLSVPYALYAKSAGSVSGGGTMTVSQTGDTLYVGSDYVIIPGLSGNNGGQGTQYYIPGPGVTFNGYNYPTIVLGNGQEWMSENLRTTNYANGDPIPNVSDSTLWVNLSTGACCHVDNNSSNLNPYGLLYNWYAVDDARDLCPSGWHVPSDSDWFELSNFLGGQLVAGGKMKTIGTQLWLYPNEGATNESGFSALAGGYRYTGFLFVNRFSYYWSSTESNNYSSGTQTYETNMPWYWGMDTGAGILLRGYQPKKAGYSIRCLRD